VLIVFYRDRAKGGFNGIGTKLAVMDSQGSSQSLQTLIFWEHVSQMLPKRLQNGSKGIPRRAQRSIFEGFLKFWHPQNNEFPSFWPPIGLGGIREA